MTQVCNPVLETATIKYSVQTGCHFLDPHYFPGTVQAHSGIDLNAVTGGDSDYGNRVRAVADGIVVAAGDYPSWGGIVLVHHPALGVYSQYAHLINICVKVGQRVGMGDRLGQIGKGANGQFKAHLHFEIRRSRLAPNYWASAHHATRAAAEKFIRAHYLDPEAWLEQHGAMRGYDEVMRVRAAREAVVQQPTATPRPPRPPRRWEPVYDPVTNKPLAGEYVSIMQRGDEVRLFKVPRDKLKQEGIL